MGHSLQSSFLSIEPSIKMEEFMLVRVLMLLLLASQSFAGIQVENRVKRSQRKLLKRDLERLKNLSFNNSSEETLNTMKDIYGLSTIDALSLDSWLDERVNYVIKQTPQGFLSMVRTIIRFGVPKYYSTWPNTPLPRVPEGLGLEGEPNEKKKVYTVMANIGTALYYAGKKSRNYAYGYRFKTGMIPVLNIKKIYATSPRVGIIAVGEGLFHKKLQINGEKKSMANSLHRISTFLHEARHSDGNGLSTGFFHAICPKGHDYEGHGACDDNINGPYKIGALATKTFSENCDECSVKDRELLRANALNSFARIFSKAKKANRRLDPQPEGLK